MGLMLGLDGIWSAVFASLVVSFLASIVLMITKKKKRGDMIPFAPAIMVGTYLSVFLTGR
jgi:leader peptidase (prepilin peptidase)/N-methyltransferase